MIQNVYNKLYNCFDFFELRNFKYKTIFHIAAKYNSVESLSLFLGKNIFLQELLKKDYKGNTPIHTAFKYGSLEIINYFLTSITKQFLNLKNDDGMNPYELMQHSYE
jgi:ankyrin repeat protein